jgi:hypothetical protein
MFEFSEFSAPVGERVSEQERAYSTRHDVRFENLGHEEGSEHLAINCRNSICVREVPGSNLCSDTFSED